MYYHSQMTAGQAPPPQTVTSHYHQAPLLPPGPGQYPPPQYSSQYAYPNGLTSPSGGPPQVHNPMNAAQPVLPLPGVSQPGMGQSSYSPGFDTTGQVAPPGMKPRVTATLWEDEGSLCFQVEARGICVARREGEFWPILQLGSKVLRLTDMFARQSHDQRHQAFECGRHDSWSARRHSQKREGPARRKNWPYAPKGSMVG